MPFAGKGQTLDRHSLSVLQVSIYEHGRLLSARLTSMKAGVIVIVLGLLL